MERKLAQTIISETLDQDIDDVDLGHLTSLRQDILQQKKSTETMDLYNRLIDALNTEISYRKEDKSNNRNIVKV